MNKKTIDSVDLKGKKVIMRVDFNVPLADGVITDDTRVQAALPSIKKCLSEGAALILMSHLGRPKGEVKPELSLSVVAKYLGELLGQDVKMAPDCIGPEVKTMAADLQAGEILMLENTRFHAAEDTKKEELKDAQKQLVELQGEHPLFNGVLGN